MIPAILNSAMLDSDTAIWILPCWIWAAILNSAMLDSGTAILDSDTLLSSLRFTQKHSSSTLTLNQTNSINSLINLMIGILNSSILNSAILDSAILHKTLTQTSLKLIHSHSTWWYQPFLNSAMLDSDTAILDSNTLLSSLRFTQKHSSSTLTLTQTNSIWLT